MTNRYATATDFKNALHEKLRSAVHGSYDLERLRRQIAFERFLARVFFKRPSPWVLKGGFAMELRTDQARSTKDIDLAYAGIISAPFPTVTKEQQFAEKLHAYTVPRKGGENSRVKDLVDLALLSTEKLDFGKLQKAIQAIFRIYSTHPIPHTLPTPPRSWNQPYIALAEECGLKLSMEESVRLAEATMMGNTMRRGISM